MRIPGHHDRLLRLLAALGGGLAFIAAATMLEPDWTRADVLPSPTAATSTPASDDSPPVEPAPGERPAVGELLLPGTPMGRLDGPRGSIEVRATPDGPRYHVLGADGRPLDPVGLTLEQLASQYPALDLRGAAADESPAGAAPALFMLADPDAAWNH